MINEMELQAVLNQEDKRNVICRSLELRPKVIAGFIANLANLPEGYQKGYILIGASEEDELTIHGLSPRFRRDVILQRALNQLSFKPKIEEGVVSVRGKDIYVITVNRTNHRIIVGTDIATRYESLIDRIMKACIKVQRTDGLKDKSEDERTDMIRDLLQIIEDVSKEKEYKISGQERQGTSKAGKASGEVDLLITNMDGIMVSVIEALNLSSLDKQYLGSHIDKVFKYDTLGSDINFLISYVNVVNFSGFWDKYIEFVSSYPYPHPLVALEERIIRNYDFADMKYLITHHNRNGKETVLFQICMKIIS